ncbi:MAG: hypothetical protein KJZ84_15770 [Bryobacteraceae bacterium]|nr:hypothetical protein [Bryobacteraceae bacterium]
MHIAIHPITTYVLMAAGFAGLLFLHFHLTAQVEKLRRQAADDLGVWRLESSRLRAELYAAITDREGLRLAPPPGVTPSWSGAGARLNVNRRSQALRMSRLGDPPERIAAALGVTRNEVDLLLKVHRAVAGAA